MLLFLQHSSKVPPVFRLLVYIYRTLHYVLFLCLSLRQHSIERAMDLTDSFTWEDLPTRDADTGHLTAAGWIPPIKMFSMRAHIGIILFHAVQSTIRIVTNHETIIIVWYPFDWNISPFYELVNISQVTISKKIVHLKYSYINLNLTHRLTWYTFLFIYVFISSVLLHFNTMLSICQHTEWLMLGWLTEVPLPLSGTVREYSLRNWGKSWNRSEYHLFLAATSDYKSTLPHRNLKSSG
jgi:hypothetical protein